MIPLPFSARRPSLDAGGPFAAETHALRDLRGVPLRRRLRRRSPSVVGQRGSQCEREASDAAKGPEPLERPRLELEAGQGERREAEDFQECRRAEQRRGRRG